MVVMERLELSTSGLWRQQTSNKINDLQEKSVISLHFLAHKNHISKDFSQQQLRTKKSDNKRLSQRVDPSRGRLLILIYGVPVIIVIGTSYLMRPSIFLTLIPISSLIRSSSNIFLIFSSSPLFGNDAFNWSSKLISTL